MNHRTQNPVDDHDRRLADRLRLPIRVTYRIKEDNNVDCTGNTTVADLSGGGIRLLVAAALKPNTSCDLSIYLPGDDQHPIEAQGVISWCTACEEREPTQYELGISFTQMSMTHRERYYMFICEQLLEQNLE